MAGRELFKRLLKLAKRFDTNQALRWQIEMPTKTEAQQEFARKIVGGTRFYSPWFSRNSSFVDACKAEKRMIVSEMSLVEVAEIMNSFEQVNDSHGISGILNRDAAKNFSLVQGQASADFKSPRILLMHPRTGLNKVLISFVWMNIIHTVVASTAHPVQSNEQPFPDSQFVYMHKLDDIEESVELFEGWYLFGDWFTIVERRNFAGNVFSFDDVRVWEEKHLQQLFQEGAFALLEPNHENSLDELIGPGGSPENKHSKLLNDLFQDLD